MAYVTLDESGYAVWMRQVATGTDVRLVPAQPTELLSLTFSPDGNYLYYASGGVESGNIFYSWLYAIPTMGGQSRKIVFDVDTPIAFSPDGSQIAFGRGVPAERQNHVIVAAAADGSGARKLAAFPRRENAARAVWSPDGRKIITPAVDPSAGWDVALMEIDVASGSTRRIGNTRRSSISDLHFLQDGSGLVVAAAHGEATRQQVWLQPYPGGAPLRVTNDLSDYEELSVTRDGSVLAARRTDTRTSLLLTSVDDRRPPTPFAAAAAGLIRDVAVSRSGAIAYAFMTGSRADIAVLDTPQSAPRVVTRAGENFGPAISADGRTIVFSSRNGDQPAHIFAIDADGSNLRQLTRGTGEIVTSVSADGKTLTYYSVANDSEIWVLSLDGGEPRKLSERGDRVGLAVSPDGRHVAFLEWQSSERAASNLKVVPVAGGAPLLNLPWTSGVQIRWHPDGKMLTARRLDRGVNNIFSVPLSGGEPTQFTKFTSGRFGSYDWTADGDLVLVRTQSTSDVVLISDWLRAPKK